MIVTWSCEFVKIFFRFNPSKLRLPKLHSWRYHIIPAIRQFGTINGFTTETYELLYKKWIKKLYRISNRRDATLQMLNTVSHYLTINVNDFIILL